MALSRVDKSRESHARKITINYFGVFSKFMTVVVVFSSISVIGLVVVIVIIVVVVVVIGARPRRQCCGMNWPFKMSYGDTSVISKFLKSEPQSL